jgi:hypothetical protein
MQPAESHTCAVPGRSWEHETTPRPHGPESWPDQRLSRARAMSSECACARQMQGLSAREHDSRANPAPNGGCVGPSRYSHELASGKVQMPPARHPVLPDQSPNQLALSPHADPQRGAILRVRQPVQQQPERIRLPPGQPNRLDRSHRSSLATTPSEEEETTGRLRRRRGVLRVGGGVSTCRIGWAAHLRERSTRSGLDAARASKTS